MGHPSREEENTQNKQLSVTQNKYILLLLFKKKPMSKKKNVALTYKVRRAKKAVALQTDTHDTRGMYVCMLEHWLIGIFIENSCVIADTDEPE